VSAAKFGTKNTFLGFGGSGKTGITVSLRKRSFGTRSASGAINRAAKLYTQALSDLLIHRQFLNANGQKVSRTCTMKFSTHFLDGPAVSHKWNYI
jgi:hypothetical protein